MRFLKSRIFIGVVAVLLSFFIIFYLIPRDNEKTRDTEKIIRVKNSVAKNSLIKENMLSVVEVGKYNLPSDVIKDKQKIINKYSAVELLPSDNLIPEKFVDSSVEDAFLYKIKNEAAISVTVKSLASGLSGKLEPGDIVSVLSYVKSSDPQNQREYVQEYPELKYVEIGAVTNSKAVNTNKVKSINEKDRDYTDTIIPATVTLLIKNDIQAKKLVEAENIGIIHLVFRGRGDEAVKLLEKNIFSDSSSQSQIQQTQIPQQTQQVQNEPTSFPTPNKKTRSPKPSVNNQIN